MSPADPIGRVGTLKLATSAGVDGRRGHLTVAVRVLAVVRRYGHVRYDVEPIAGSGRATVKASRVRLVKDA